MGKKIYLVIFGLLFFQLFFFGCTEPSETIKKLQSVEVKEYQGENLSSISDFRENSIKGPQYIDIENYKLEVSGLVENPKNFSYGEVLDRQKYSKVVTLNCVEG